MTIEHIMPRFLVIQLILFTFFEMKVEVTEEIWMDGRLAFSKHWMRS